MQHPILDGSGGLGHQTGPVRRPRNRLAPLAVIECDINAVRCKQH
jgi:hypothetical protein